MKSVVIITIVLCTFCVTICALKNTTTTPRTTLSPKEECQILRNCSSCLKLSKCLWCYSDNKCKLYPVGHIIPRHEDCPLNDARWLVCWFNMKILIIVMSCLAAVTVLSCGCTIYCCCCRKNRSRVSRKLLADDAKLERERVERKTRNDEKRAERKVKTDEIRRKYGIEPTGLMKEDTPYQRFDA